jgi:hypothetical protein
MKLHGDRICVKCEGGLRAELASVKRELKAERAKVATAIYALPIAGGRLMARPLLNVKDFWIDAEAVDRIIPSYPEDPVVTASCEAIRKKFPGVQVTAIRFHGFSKQILCPAKEGK